jgi:hypothetical protein
MSTIEHILQRAEFGSRKLQHVFADREDATAVALSLSGK